MKLSKVLLVFKKSTFQLQAREHKEPRFLKLLEKGHAAVAKVQSAHEQHTKTLEFLEQELKARKITYDKVHRADLGSSLDSYDLVISVGGDGTFLDTSHMLKNIPLLGVNSAISTSFGHFCLANVDNFSGILGKISKGQIQPFNLLRLQLKINGKLLKELPLNEVLISHSNPAGTTRYIIEIGNKKEEQRSSGIWIGTPAGSTGALKSAGGTIMNITANQYQFVVREPWTRPTQHFELTKDILSSDEQINIISQMRTGVVCIDGQHIQYPLNLGDELTIYCAKDSLLAFVNPATNEIFHQDKRT